ncbi:hypothetical protein CTAYLR_010375 [Chrysophaeum taylorii]|uniref:NADP-dependent oxidoreductase domain-containing protein n=1 Tax=Chrysophaeum taylorii TaxID=2483200 RepID=A0AAD7UI41_9STRA|nr:hypothetical protein CTAYLR_010375 [Chrysophaeum taylorii]
MRQTIEFEASRPLGLGVDDTLQVQRINDPLSPAVTQAKYSILRWRVVAVDGRPVATKEGLVEALAAARDAERMVELTFEAASEQQQQQQPMRPPPPPPPVKRPKVADEGLDEVVEEKVSEEARELLQLRSTLPSFELAGERTTRLLTGSCTWQLNPGDATRSDVAVHACAAYTVLGCRTFDCGDIYAGVEELVGRFVATARGHSRDLADCVRIHTKVIPDVSARKVTLGRRIAASVLRSANRLGVPTIDVVKLHWWDASQPGFGEALEALRGLKRRGVVRAIGLCNVPSLGDAEDVACVQCNLSLVDRRPLVSGLVAEAKRRGLAVLAHGCLCGGLVSDAWIDRPPPAVDDLPPGMAANRVYIDEFGGWDAFQALLHTLREIAEGKGCTVSQVAIAWTLRGDGVSAVVLGARDADHVKKAATAVSMTLTDAEVAKIDARLRGRGPTGPVFGLERDPDHVLYRLCGAGADGSLRHPVDRNASLAGSETHLKECAARLRVLHDTYDRAMPPVPDDLELLRPRRQQQEEGTATTTTTTTKKPWMASSAYKYLTTHELVLLLRSFVAEIDCLADDDDADQIRPVRTFAAKMLASAEQALFVEAREESTTSPRASRPSHSRTTSKAAEAASAAFRDRILQSCARIAKAAAAQSAAAAGGGGGGGVLMQGRQRRTETR